jgi:hypothetical protein
MPGYRSEATRTSTIWIAADTTAQQYSIQIRTMRRMTDYRRVEGEPMTALMYDRSFLSYIYVSKRGQSFICQIRHLNSASLNLQLQDSDYLRILTMTQPFIGNDNARVTPFTVHISEDSLIQLDTLLNITPIAEPTYETSLPDGDRKYGMRHDWLTKAVEEWKTTFDW